MSERPAVVVVGLGYVGLPLAQEAARAGYRVIGLDTDPGLVEGLMAGMSHIDDLDDADIRGMLSAGFEATTDEACIAQANVVVICVPTPLAAGGSPDLSAVLMAVASVAQNVSKGTLVVLESTTYPGTTDEVVVPALESSGLRVGDDLHVAFSPERIDPGNPTYGFRNTPKIVGGVTPDCTRAAERFYSQLVDEVVVAAGPREAEMSKLLENTYRSVNIALVNEMAKFCHELGIDFWDVIRCASTKPFGFAAFHPGPGVGGHCIPIDPGYLSFTVRARLGYPFRFVELAQEVNQGMPAYVVRRVQDALNSVEKPIRGSAIMILGVTYKADIADERESPAQPIAQQLLAAGARVRFHDPYVQKWAPNGDSVMRVDDVESGCREADLVLVLQHHASYDIDRIAQASSLLLDTRGKVAVETHARRL